MTYRDNIASLILSDITASDIGEYTCKATNKYGFTATSGRLILTGRKVYRLV